MYIIARRLHSRKLLGSTLAAALLVYIIARHLHSRTPLEGICWLRRRRQASRESKIEKETYRCKYTLVLYIVKRQVSRESKNSTCINM